MNTEDEKNENETEVHTEIAHRLGHISEKHFRDVDDAYEKICAQIVRMIEQPQKWLIRATRNEKG